MNMKTALTIAGSDCSGGAGIQADLKTMTMNGVYAMSVITALTAQNTTGVRAIQESSPEFLKQQLDAVFEDIYPDAVKIGMVSSRGLIRVIAERLRYYGAGNIVIDPVMVATSGSALMKTDAVQTLIDELFPLATLVTPNISEAQILSGLSITSKDDMLAAAERISTSYGCAVLLKAATASMTQTTCSIPAAKLPGSMAGASITSTLTVRAAPSPAPSPQTLPRATALPGPLQGQRNISPARSPPCLIWARAPGP